MHDHDPEQREIERELGDRYQIVRTLGRGAFGAVYLARERQLHRLVAVKVLHADRAWSDDERARLLREARTLANLSHPAIVPLLAFGETASTVYMVMPYVGGETLADRMRDGERMDAREVRRILIEVADALAYTHGEGVLHRDLKPENILLERAGAVTDDTPPRVRLIDFGVAAFPTRDPGMNASRETWGTPHFMAPEQAFGEPELDPRSELYSLGVLGYLLLGGRLPFEATSPTERLVQQRRGPAVPLEACAPDAPHDLVDAVMRCLAYEPEKRWARARDLRDALVRGAVPAGEGLASIALVRQRLRGRRGGGRARRRAPDPGIVAARGSLLSRAVAGLGTDLRFALRTLRKTPAFTAAVVLTLAIGLSATTVVFSAVEALVLRALPVSDPASLVILQEERRGPNDASSFGSSLFRYDRYLAYRDATTGVLSGLAAQNTQSFSVRLGDGARSVNGLTTSGNYFQVLGVRPALGRFYDASVDRPGGAQGVVVVGHDFWQRTLGGDPAAVGRTLFLDSRPLTIVGVAPRGFRGAMVGVLALDVWVPSTAYQRPPPGVAATAGPNYEWMNVFGRLRPGMSRERATVALRVIGPRVPTEARTTRITDVWLDPMKAIPGELQKPVERFMAMLLGVAGMVLLIAATNAAGMLLARSTARAREVATRLAVGASRARLVRQLLVESTVLCAIAGAAGLVLTWWAMRALDAWQPVAQLPVAIGFGVNARVLAVAAATVLGTALLAGLAPALQSTAMNLAAAMKEGGLQSGTRRTRLRSAFVVAQVALSVVLLTVAGLFVRSLQRTLAMDPGFDAANVAHVSVDLGTHGYDRERARDLYARLGDALRAHPSIAAASFANFAPLTGNVQTWHARRTDRPADEPTMTNWSLADAGFVELLRTRLLAGRTFTRDDGPNAQRAVVINEALARRLWPGERPTRAVGREIEILDERATVVGVLATGRYGTLHEEEERPFAYLAFAQHPRSFAQLYVRARGDMVAALRAVREELATLDPNVAVETPTLLTTDIDRYLLPQRVSASLVGMFGVAGLALAMAGLYGVLAFGVAQRLGEFGVRMALGARAADLTRLVVRNGLVLAAVGIAIGVVAAVAAGQMVRTFLFGLSPADPLTLVAVPLLLLVVALLASLIPARRAAAADPMTSLRAE